MTSLKSQDVALLVKLLSKAKDENWRQVDLAMDLGISQGEIAKALARLNHAGLISGKRVNRTGALEFILHAVKYVFPIELGPLGPGVPTGISDPTHKGGVLQSGDDVYVWPHIHGSIRGQVIYPFYPKLAEAALKDPSFYEMMSAVEILRMGRARERKFAEKFLEKRIKDS